MSRIAHKAYRDGYIDESFFEAVEELCVEGQLALEEVFGGQDRAEVAIAAKVKLAVESSPEQVAETRAMMARFESCRLLAKHVVAKVGLGEGGKLFGRDDLEQVALQALAKAAAQYNEERKVKFSSLAYTYMSNAVTSAVRKELHRREHEPDTLNRSVKPDDESGVEVVDHLSYTQTPEGLEDPAIASVKNERKAHVNAAVDALPANQKKLVVQWMEGRSMSDVCRESGGNARSELRRAFASIRTSLVSAGYGENPAEVDSQQTQQDDDEEEECVMS